ncbi:MAG: hypothetical protein KI791_04800 [Cyclobacteriaceae bacterium]|nr:hypothetical protein [Cyclobacteriaceae bacterium SS2]
MLSKKISKYVKFFLTVYGLYKLWDLINSQSNSIELTITIISVVIFLLLIYEFFKYLYNPFLYRFFKISPFEQQLIISGSQTIEVQSDGTAEADTKRTYLFLDEPKSWNLFDTILTTKDFDGHNLNSFFYSDDSDVVSFTRIKKKRLLLFWKPKTGKINKYIPYEHHYHWVPPNVNFNDDKNFWVFVRLYAQGEFNLELKTHRKIKEAWIIDKPKYKDLSTEEKIEKEIKNRKHFDLPQPAIKSDHLLTWHIQETNKPLFYILFWSYEN